LREVSFRSATRYYSFYDNLASRSMENRTVNAIIVEIGPATDLGRLYPKYDESVGILAVESKLKRPWPFGVDIEVVSSLT